MTEAEWWWASPLEALAHIRAFHLRVTAEVLRRLEHGRPSIADVASFACQ